MACFNQFNQKVTISQHWCLPSQLFVWMCMSEIEFQNQSRIQSESFLEFQFCVEFQNKKCRIFYFSPRMFTIWSIFAKTCKVITMLTCFRKLQLLSLKTSLLLPKLDLKMSFSNNLKLLSFSHPILTFPNFQLVVCAEWKVKCQNWTFNEMLLQHWIFNVQISIFNWNVCSETQPVWTESADQSMLDKIAK